MVLILGSAYVHGVLTNRWGTPPDLSAAAAKLDSIPQVVGDWHSQPLTISEGQLKGAEAVGHLSRIYRNDKTQAEIQIMILCGPHGAIAVHPPTICFTSAGLQQDYPEKMQAIEAGGAKGAFWKTLFTKRTPDGLRTELETYWAWSVHGECQAPGNPRLEFASSPHLYKMYVTHLRRSSLDLNVKESTEAPCEDFLKAFLPVFRKTISESESSTP